MIVGIDEVGRGCWAGPLVVAGVALGRPIEGLRDSKRLTSKVRAVLQIKVLESAEATSIAWIQPSRIDEIGLSEAMRQACRSIYTDICNKHDTILIDGNINYLPDKSGVRTVVGGDDLEPSIMAASILAKEARDQYMVAVASRFPEYGFESHVGYGTKQHMEALSLHGVTELHRNSYKPIKRYLSEVGRYTGGQNKR